VPLDANCILFNSFPDPLAEIAVAQRESERENENFSVWQIFSRSTFCPFALSAWNGMRRRVRSHPLSASVLEEESGAAPFFRFKLTAIFYQNTISSRVGKIPAAEYEFMSSAVRL